MYGNSQMLDLGAGGYNTSQGNPFASQTQTQSPEKRARQEDKQTCMPATIRLLVDSKSAGEEKGAELQLHGTEVANVTLVGVAEGISQQATMLEFTLNDGSGRMKVRHYQSSDGIAKLTSGSYVSVVGSLRTSPSLHVSALSLRLVTSADEVSYHMIEVAHAALMLKNGGSRVPTPPPVKVAPALLQPSQPNSAPPAAAPQPKNVIATPAADLRTAVMTLLRNEGEGRPEGIPRTALNSHFKTYPESEVRAVLENLMDNGEVFNTIDEDHFSAV